MATAGGSRNGRCVNIGNCTLADGRKDIAVASGSDFVCPECGRGLITVAGSGGGGRVGRVPPWALVAGGTVLLGGLAYGAWSLIPEKAGGKPVRPGEISSTDTKPILRLGGSNTIGDKLAPALAEGWLKSQGCSEVTRKAPEKDELLLSCTADGKDLVVSVASHGTKTGFEGLKDGKYDIAMASDKIDDEAAMSLSALGDMHSSAAEHVIGFDGVAVIVNRSNSIAQLTLAQVSQLFSGQITDWSQVGGTPGPVKVYARDQNSGTTKFFDRVVLKARGGALTPDAKRFEKGSELADGVASDVAGIGFVGAASTEVAKVVPIVAEAGGTPLLPNGLTIRTGDYVLSRRLYLYVPPKRTSAEVARFLAYADSSAGEQIVKEMKFTPLTMEIARQSVPVNAPPAYREATSDAGRLKFNFKFNTNGTELDNLAQSDLKKLADFLASRNIPAERLMLIGFTDNQGSPDPARRIAYNNALSIRRAESVAAQLKSAGVSVGSAVGFGEALPVAPNSDEEGRSQNRRVEVWVRP